MLLGEGNIEDSLAVSREFVASLYDQKAKLRADYSNLNTFRVRFAIKKRSKPDQVTTMRSDIPSACTKSIFADLYLEILTKSAAPC